MIKRAKIVREAGATPEMAVLTALLRALPAEIKGSIVAQLSPAADHPPSSLARQAYELCRLEQMTNGEVSDWEFANDWLNRKEG